MTIEVLREFARNFAAAADGLEKYNTLEQAVSERNAELARLDAKVAASREELASVQAKAAESAANIANIEDEFRRTEKARREALDAELEQRKQAADAEFRKQETNLQLALDLFEGRRATLEGEVVALRDMRDALAAEIKSTKERLAAL